jgi:hypothetical protein
MKITIDIKTDNAAFDDDDMQIFNIISDVQAAVVIGKREGNLRDSNGNAVGKFKVTGK